MYTHCDRSLRVWHLCVSDCACAGDDKLVVKDFVQFSGKFNVFGVDNSEDDDANDDNAVVEDVKPTGDDRDNESVAPVVPQAGAPADSPKLEGFLSMQGILRALGSRALDSFRFAESLVITQNYEDEEDDDDSRHKTSTHPPREDILHKIESGALDGFKFAESLIITQTQEDNDEGADEDDEDEGRDTVKVPVVCLSPQVREDVLPPRRRELALAPSVSNHDFTVFGVDLDDDDS